MSQTLMQKTVLEKTMQAFAGQGVKGSLEVIVTNTKALISGQKVGFHPCFHLT